MFKNQMESKKSWLYENATIFNELNNTDAHE